MTALGLDALGSICSNTFKALLIRKELVLDHFGEDDSRNMPSHFFWECIVLNHDSAIRANVELQNYSVCPRHWYVDATFQCKECKSEFCFFAWEQQRWYEDFGFYVDSFAKFCPDCRKRVRHAKELRQEYDSQIQTVIQSQDVELKNRICGVIDDLYEIAPNLPKRIHFNRKTLAVQIAKANHNDAPQAGDRTKL